ncbi:MAG TPA: NADH-quinone oxidoreductase subunit A [Gemmatimonadales bacterium]|nr:NADH-quinone oxidoreductase subunit A [Gemmatimonadales bacterium]
MNQPYLSFLLLLAFVAFNAVLLIGLSHLLSPRRPTPLKDTPYESGMPPLGSAHERFSVKFYLVAMLFIIFDIETVFLIPWGAIYLGGGGAAAPGGVAGAGAGGGPSTGFLLLEMLVFMVILAVGYVYVWKRGALEWD